MILSRFLRSILTQAMLIFSVVLKFLQVISIKRFPQLRHCNVKIWLSAEAQLDYVRNSEALEV